ncbi:protein phosphatase 1 regulatory subunit 36 isoform X2 [Anolis carolinensis]|uniref:protein phosphatase 1 regulatory subunit 36 isoform X2 n=1 Tax=Anolis carolinensis TaxID=28377 RepID=UPI000462CE6A|nr:PREDICTED: protein phosphatase 1 regulatory subunit 36 isoform X2 [Anolis carolinensis]|eukprot:XP_008106769.1 PREDICTED: protein phosphatase 1 regulatory subunit 36 isoform X2 [Anolis carolinensis]
MSNLQFLELPKGAVVSITKVTAGIWYWKDDTRTLEFSCAYPKDDAKEQKDKSKKGSKVIHFQDVATKPMERPGPIFFRDIYPSQSPSQDEKVPRSLKRGQNELIALEDVKYAAIFLAQEEEFFHAPTFSTVIRCKQLDDFLMALLYYMSFYLEKLALEMKPRSFMGRKISAAQKDREFFECLYNFAAYVAFVTFRQKNLKEIQQEVGRLLRSNMFNPALRDRTKVKEIIKTDVTKEITKVPFPYRKKTDPRQPAIRSVMDQRSPVLSTLLPMAKDSAQYLFQDHYLRPGKSPPRYAPEELPELTSIVSASNIGIIGCPRNRFIPHTLLPICCQEEAEKEEEGSVLTKTSITSLFTRELSGSSRPVQDSGSHPSVSLSRPTTEGDYTEDPL